MKMLLIHPPVSKPCEPPAGLATLAGALRRHGIPCMLLDANIEGILSLLGGQGRDNDTWTRRAYSHLASNLAALEQWDAYTNIGRYTRAVTEITRILQVVTLPYGSTLGLANFTDQARSPLSSADLLQASEMPEKNVFYHYFQQRLPAVLEQENPSIVGFSLNYLSQALIAFAMIGYVKKLSPAMKIMLGGGLVTSWLQRLDWRNPFAGLVDAMVAGPGERPLLALAGIQAADDSSLPDYDPVRGAPYFSPGRVLPYSVSLGCYWGRCSFCPEKTENRGYRCSTSQDVLHDLKALIARENPSLVHLLDNALSPSLLAALAACPLRVPWYGFARFTSHLTDLDFCRELKRSGCTMLQIGLESGDQGVLDALQKGIDLTEAGEVLKNLKMAGIATYVYLLFGTPPETYARAQKTLDFILDHRDCLDFLNLAIFNLPSGSLDARELDTYDFYDGDLCLYKGFVHPHGWHRKLVRRFLDKEFRRHPAIAPILRRDPPVFTSNHAPFFVMAHGEYIRNRKGGSSSCQKGFPLKGR